MDIFRAKHRAGYAEHVVPDGPVVHRLALRHDWYALQAHICRPCPAQVDTWLRLLRVVWHVSLHDMCRLWHAAGTRQQLLRIDTAPASLRLTARLALTFL